MPFLRKDILPLCLYGLMVTYSIFLLIMACCFILLDYATLVTWFTSRYPQAFQVDQFANTYFTSQHYHVAGKLSLFIIVLVGLFLLVLLLRFKTVNKILKYLTDDVNIVLGIVRSSFVQLTRMQKYIVYGILVYLLIVRTYLAITLPFQVDEVFNFIYFVKNGFLHTSIFSNNHILYNLTSVLWADLGASSKVASRLTSILSSLLTFVVLFAYVKHFFNFSLAIFILTLCGLSFWVSIYNVEGYSYTLTTLFWLINFISIVHHIQNPQKGYYLFAITAVLGLYCSKLYIMPFLSFIMLWTIIIVYQRNVMAIVEKIIPTVAAVIFFTGLLYLPMFLWSGAPSVFLTNLTRHDLILQSPLLFENFSVMTDLVSRSYIVIIGLLLWIAISFRNADNKNKVIFALFITTLISLAVFIIISGLYPPSRAFVFTNILFSCTLAIALSSLLADVKVFFKRFTYVGLLVVKAMLSTYFYCYGWQRTLTGGLQDSRFYADLSQFTEQIMSVDPHLIYLDQRDTHLDFYLRLSAINAGKKVDFTYRPELLSKSDVAIIEGNSSPPNPYEKLTEDRRWGVVYLRKE